jgi:hypothetical protein
MPMAEDHTSYFFATHFGLSQVPRWWNKRTALCSDLAALWDKRQAIYYLNEPEAPYRALQRSISFKYGISFPAINHLLGVAATDGSNPYGVIRDYLDQGQQRLKQTSR